MDELQGLTILELGDFIPAPYCCKLLADVGAEVIKIERPGAVPGSRRFGPFPGDQPHPEKSLLYLYLNGNKKGITLNLDKPEGCRIFKDLARTADILVEETPPGYMEGRGLDYPTLKQVNERLIFVSISPFGRSGPYKDYLGYDLHMWHGSGSGQKYLMEPGREPVRGAWYMASHWAGMNAAAGALVALFARDLTGRGQFVDAAVAESIATLSVSPPNITQYKETGELPPKTQGGSPMHRTKDGFINIMALTPQQWEGLVAVMGNPEWAQNPAYKGHSAQRSPYVAEIRRGMDEWLSQQPTMEVFEACFKHSVPAAPVLTMKDILDNEHLQARGFFVESDHPAAGRLRMPGGLVRGPGEALVPPRPAPLLGQHTDEVLGGRLGLSREEIARLEEQEII